MTLTEHAHNVAKLIEEAREKGIDPEKIVIYTTNSASGATNELSNGYLLDVTGDERSGPVDFPKGTPYVSFYN